MNEQVELKHSDDSPQSDEAVTLEIQDIQLGHQTEVKPNGEERSQ